MPLYIFCILVGNLSSKIMKTTLTRQKKSWHNNLIASGATPLNYFIITKLLCNYKIKLTSRETSLTCYLRLCV